MSELKNQELPVIRQDEVEATRLRCSMNGEGISLMDQADSLARRYASSCRLLSTALNELKAANERFAYFQRLTCEQHERDVQAIAAKDTELAAKDARIAELESYKLNADHALNLSILDSEELQSRLGAVSEVLKKYEPDLRDTIRQIRSIVEGNHAK